MWKLSLIFILPIVVLLSLIILRALCCRQPRIRKHTPVELTIDKALVTRRLSQIIQFETISDNEDEITHPEAFAKLHAYLSKTYSEIFEQLEIQRFGEFAMLLKWQGSEPDLKPFMCIAHQDVVPVPHQECDDWRFPPFSGVVADDYIWGRGALDMKSTLAAILEAVTRLLKENYQPKRTLYIYLGDDEEVAGPTAKKAAAWMAAQGIHLSYIIDEGGAILENMLPGIQPAVALIGIGQKGAMNLQLKARGDSGHAAKPPRSTPIDTLGTAVAKLKQREMPVHSDSLVFSLLRQVVAYAPFSQRLILTNLWLFKSLVTAKLQKSPFMNAMLRTTAVATVFQAGIKKNVIPELATANINYRLYPGDTRMNVLEHVKKQLKNNKVSVEVSDDFNATPWSKTDSFGFNTISETIRKVSRDHIIIAPVLTIGGTDGRHFRALCDDLYQFLFIRGPMDEFKGYHGINERISVENYLNSIKFYYQLIQDSEA